MRHIQRSIKRFSAWVGLLFFVGSCQASVLGAGGFVASRNSDVYHVIGCSYVNQIKESNKIYFDTAEEAEASGRHGCSRCKPDLVSTSPSSNGNTTTLGSDSEDGERRSARDILEAGIEPDDVTIEWMKAYPGKTIDNIMVSGPGYSNGYRDGYEDRDREAIEQSESAYRSGYEAGIHQVDVARDEGFEEGFDEGFEAGSEEGYQNGLNYGKELGYESGYNEGILEGDEKSWKYAGICILAIFAAEGVITVIVIAINRTKRKNRI